jgi:hypothetical protein
MFQHKFNINNQKPKMSIRDISLDSDSDNDISDEKNSIEKNNDLDMFPKENTISSINISNNRNKVQNEPIHIPFNDIESSQQQKEGIFYSLSSVTNDKVAKKDSNERNDDFTIIKHVNLGKENNRYERYNSNMSEIYNNNFKFYSSFEDDYKDEDDDIVNNEITSNLDDYIINTNNRSNRDIKADYIKGFNATYKFNKGKNVEILLQPDVSKIFENDEIANNNIINERSNNIIDFSKSNFDSKTFENMRYREEDNSKSNNDLKVIEENNKKSKIYNKEVDSINNKDINLNESKEKNNNTNINVIKSIDNKNNEGKSASKNQTEIMSKKKSNEYKKKITFLNLTKQNKIFQKFLCVSVDTSGLYSLDDEMKILLLNPKITYNYPFNKMERELE